MLKIKLAYQLNNW